MEGQKIDWRKLGNRIAEMRLARGVTQAELAERTGLSANYIGYLERGDRHGVFETYLQIVRALGYSLNDLVAEEVPEDTLSSLAWELKEAFEACSGSEQESVMRIVREMTRMIRLFHGD